MNDINADSPIKRRRSLSSELTDWFRKEISEGRLAPGDKLPTEQAIVKKMEVSRTVVREAVAALKADGLVVTRQGVGAFVAPPSHSEHFKIGADKLDSLEGVLQLLELRIAFETEIAGLAAERRTDEQLEVMKVRKAEIDRLTAAGEDSTDADMALHLALAEGTQNTYFVDFFNFLGAKLVPPRSLVVKKGGGAHSAYVQKINKEHADIIEAIERKDASAAREAARKHLTNSRDRHAEMAKS